MKKFFGFISLLASLFSSAQTTAEQTTDSCQLTISLLTCTPGEELYSSFGHSAIRVTDDNANTDLVFNYGTFDFNDPHFYKKFVQGKLLYFVSVDELNNFLAEYDYFKRGVTEQVLNLSCEQKQKLVAALFENAREENKYYRYDFNYDNCTTRLRDMIEKITGGPLQTTNILPDSNTTFRNLIHDYLQKGNQYWSQLGIDILLGSPLDKKITNREAMFLPDYLLMAFDSAVTGNKKLVYEKESLLPAVANRHDKSYFTPVLVFAILFLLITALSLFRQHSSPVFFKIFDFSFFLALGLLGLLLVFMWFGTEHAMCKNNFNLLWALPLHTIAAFFIFSKKEWVQFYFRFIFFYSLVLLGAWFALPQQLNTALIPVLGIIIVRSHFISKKATEAQKH